MTFRTDGDEVVTATGQNTDERDNAPSGTVGFKLDYTQISC